MREITGKTAIVTGGASGIGLGIARALTEAGANVCWLICAENPLKRHGRR